MKNPRPFLLFKGKGRLGSFSLECALPETLLAYTSCLRTGIFFKMQTMPREMDKMISA